MKNKERFAKDILEIACSGDSIAVTKEDERVVQCGNIACSECLFACLNCVEKIREWVEQEYIEKPVISKRDRAFLDYLNCNYKYIARDMSCELCVYFSKPDKITSYWKSTGELSGNLKIFNIDFPMVKWLDDKPWLIEDLKKLEVVDEYEK